MKKIYSIQILRVASQRIIASLTTNARRVPCPLRVYFGAIVLLLLSLGIMPGKAKADCNYSWAAQTSGTSSQLLTVSAVSGQIAWAAGAGPTVRRTLDGGATWTSATGTGITGDIFNIYAVDGNTAFCTTTPAATIIYKTINGGTTWTQVFTLTGGFIDAIQMISPTEGYAVGDPVGGKWVILRTVDGGNTWTRMATEPTQVGGEAGWNNSFLIIGTNIWFGTSNTRVYHSTDLGATWSFAATTGTLNTFALHFNSTGASGLGLASGSAMLKSIDGGTSYTATGAPGTTGNIDGLEGNGTDWWALRSNANIYRSTDQGATAWTIVYTQAGAVFQDIDFVVEGSCAVGWAVGDGGNIAKMTPVNTSPSFTNGANVSVSVCQNSSNTSINSLLTVSDPDNAQTLTWTVVSGPSHGTANGFPATAATPGTSITPAGLSYSTSAYFGGDVLVVQVSDGVATAQITIDITVQEQQTWYYDGDGDGYHGATQVACTNPGTGWSTSTIGTDCNDNDAQAQVQQTWYLDADADGYYVSSQVSCGSPGAGYTTSVIGSGDCDDADNSKWQQATLYIDADGDGYDAGQAVVCYGNSIPSGYSTSTLGSDCDDSNPAYHAVQTWYHDADGDGYDGGSADYCVPPDASWYLSTLGSDCNDNDGTVYTPQQYYVDTDEDGYGSTTTGMVCSSTAPTGYSTNSTDCDDTNAAVNPGATDVCNGIDDNCDLVVDENPLVATITPSGTVSYCRLVPVTLTANTGSGVTYQWYKGNTIQPGATNSTFTTTRRGSFRVVETTGFCTSTSAYTTVARLATPQANITVFSSTDLCPSGSVLMRANNAGSSNNTHTYQWNKGGLMISGSTDRLYTATSTGDYTVTVTNDNGCSTTSSPVTVYSSCKEAPPAMFSAELNLYPNPNHGDFVVELKLADLVSNVTEITEADIQIMNALGQNIYLNHTAIVNGELFEDVKLDETVPGGNYFVRVIVGDKVYTGKIVYQK